MRPATLLLGILLAPALFAQDLEKERASVEKGRALGASLVEEFTRRAPVLSDAAATAYVQSLLQKLTAVQNVSLNLSLLGSRDPLVLGLPGGFLILTSGAIFQAESEAELAALLSHAIGHIQSPRAAPVTQGLPIVYTGCARFNGTGANEVQLDTLAIDYLVAAGYDPSALISVFDRWNSKSAPSTEVRAAASSRVSANAVWNTSEFDRIKARLTPAPVFPRRRPTLEK